MTSADTPINWIPQMLTSRACHKRRIGAPPRVIQQNPYQKPWAASAGSIPTDRLTNTMARGGQQMQRVRRFTYGLLAAIAVGAMSISTLSAQSAQGGLRGVVKDPQGVIPGVTVTLTNEANNVSRETVTNSVGEYSFPAVDPGTYTVKAGVSGYKTFERKGVRISTSQVVGLDVTLEVGQLEETITVTADAPLIETTNASTGDVMDAKAIDAIPTAGRSVFMLANLQPTVQASGNAHWNRMQDQVGNSAVSIGGGAVRANNYLVDGFPVTDLQDRKSVV